MTLDELRVLIKVVDAKSFGQAADLLGMQRSNVSRVIAQLERELGVTLLERTTRRQSVTEAGRAIYERALGVLAGVDDMLRVTQRIHAEPQGHLRVTCGAAFAMDAVSAWIEAFLGKYPKVTAEVEFATREIDLVHEGFDLAIRAGPMPGSSLVARRMGQFDYGLFASPGYLDRHGTPTDPRELATHQLVVFTGDGGKPEWTLHHPQQPDCCKVSGVPRLRANAGAGVRSALLAGLGVGQLPVHVAQPLVMQRQLVPVAHPWCPAPVPVFAVYPSRRYLTSKVRSFVDLACESLSGLTAARAVTDTTSTDVHRLYGKQRYTSILIRRKHRL
ncbi:LysR family transcriptional regulator [Polaromonas sp.]|uniref:LysR family transcriptional regulator n=1 Tax=Polaromonas sp. TaxID=1869339 RepID=UPI00272FF23E|nr:LysR family transcriptional regulator [Polaromonas sp.]MDP1742662.1 LysR family transcriptional regulator [Polaromonas sp.]